MEMGPKRRQGCRMQKSKHIVECAVNHACSKAYASRPYRDMLHCGLLASGVLPTEIDYVVVNSSLFNPDPSMPTMVAERFGMRPDVQQFFMAGMPFHNKHPSDVLYGD